MTIVFELITAVIFLLIATLIFRNKDYHKRLFIAILISYMFFYDFLNFHLAEVLGQEIMTFKIGLEFFTLCAYVKILVTKKINKKAALYFKMISAIAFWALLFGMLNGSTVKSIYLDFRSLILPILLVISLIQSGIQESISLKFVINCVSIILLINGIYSLFEYLTYTGEFQTYWRYRSLLKSKLGLNSEYNEGQLFYQIVRGEDIRSSGFIVSALAAGYLYGFVALYYFIIGIEIKNISKKMPMFLCGTTFLAFSYLTQVRTSFIMVALGMGIIVLMKFYRSNNARKRLAYMVPFIMMAGLYLYLTSGISLFKDASSQGRLLQYSTLIKQFTVAGSGLGSFPRAFDSYFIYTLLELGLGAFALYYLFYKMMINESVNRISNLHVYCQFAIFLFICSFQHISGSVYYFVFLIIISKNDLDKLRIRKGKKVVPDYLMENA